MATPPSTDETTSSCSRGSPAAKPPVKPKRPLLASKSLLRMGILKSRKDHRGEGDVERGGKASSRAASVKHREMAKRANSLDYFSSRRKSTRGRGSQPECDNSPSRPPPASS